MKETYITQYGYSEEALNLAEFLCEQNGGHLNYHDHDMVVYWLLQVKKMNTVLP